MDRTICEHGDVLSACIDCTVAPPNPQPVRPVIGVGAPFAARFEGQCPDCNLPITVGALIARMSDETYRHVGCIEWWAA